MIRGANISPIHRDSTQTSTCQLPRICRPGVSQWKSLNLSASLPTAPLFPGVVHRGVNKRQARLPRKPLHIFPCHKSGFSHKPRDTSSSLNRVPSPWSVLLAPKAVVVWYAFDLLQRDVLHARFYARYTVIRGPGLAVGAMIDSNKYLGWHRASVSIPVILCEWIAGWLAGWISWGTDS